jgi:L-ribulose-5-phosphate 3-epimerase
MKTGVTQIIYAKHPTADFIKDAAGAGYQSVELSLRKEGDLTLQTNDAALQQIVSDLAKNKLELSSLSLNHLTGNLLDSGQAQRTGIDETIAGLHVAKKLGAKCTLHTLGRLSADLYYEDAWNNAIAALKEIARTCDALDIDLAIEFVWNGFLFSPLEMRRFIEEVGSPRIGFYFDPGNMAVFHFPQHWVRALGKHIKRVHLKDWKGRALNGGWTPLLEGEVNFPVVMAELRQIGFDGALTSEVSVTDASLEVTRQAIEKIIQMG